VAVLPVDGAHHTIMTARAAGTRAEPPTPGPQLVPLGPVATTAPSAVQQPAEL
jgi:hypothetical protein